MSGPGPQACLFPVVQEEVDISKMQLLNVLLLITLLQSFIYIVIIPFKMMYSLGVRNWVSLISAGVKLKLMPRLVQLMDSETDE